ncbi:MAG: type II toxin-antitoxin system PemK/MazF family toxin [Planctomycetes bacterium]|nr:type II toxin-antitoxin system PemK/MazF family toxin [Planctomycetota bacterium]
MKPGEIYWASLEDGGRRPVLVVSIEPLNRGDHVVALPFTSTRYEDRRNLPTSVPFRAKEFGLAKDCVAAAEAVTVVDKALLDTAGGPIGSLSQGRMRDVVRAIGRTIGAECEPV